MVPALKVCDVWWMLGHVYLETAPHTANVNMCVGGSCERRHLGQPSRQDFASCSGREVCVHTKRHLHFPHRLPPVPPEYQCHVLRCDSLGNPLVAPPRRDVCSVSAPPRPQLHIAPLTALWPGLRRMRVRACACLCGCSNNMCGWLWQVHRHTDHSFGVASVGGCVWTHGRNVGGAGVLHSACCLLLAAKALRDIMAQQLAAAAAHRIWCRRRHRWHGRDRVQHGCFVAQSVCGVCAAVAVAVAVAATTALQQ